MSCNKPLAALAGLVFCLLPGGCARKPAAWQRVAVLPFENLTADPGADWLSRGLAEAVRLHLAGSAEVDPFPLDSLREAAGAHATRVLHGYITRAGSRLRVETVLEQVAEGRMVKAVAASGESVLPLARSLALGVGGQARWFGAAHDTALRAYVEGRYAGGARAAVEGFQRAVAEDADFGAAYLSWAQRLAAAGEVAGAREVLARAGQRGNRLPELERARLAVLAAGWEGDRAAEQEALQALARAAPAEAGVWRRLGETELGLCRYRDAVNALQQAAARDPRDAWLLNQLGYAQSYTRDLAGAVRSLERYRELRPEDANPLDSLGDVHYYLGRFAEAEKYYLAAWSKAPGFLGGGEPYKAAWARLMGGNRQGADELFEKYIEARRAGGDPSVELRRAQWEYLTGRQREARARLEGQGSVAARVQLAVWKLAEGDRMGAREWAAQAAAAARDPASALMARLSQYLAGPEGAAAEWAARAQRAFPEAVQSVLRRTALAYALLLTRQYAAALPLLREIHESTPASANEPTNVLLAWALIETGQAGEAGGLLDTYPVPQPGAEQVFECLSFPRVLQLRGVVRGQGARGTGSR